MTYVPETRPLPPPIPRVSPNDRRKHSSLVHGLASRRAVLDHEDKEAYRELVRSVAEAYRPADALEEHLVVEMATTTWRTARARAIEVRLLETGGRLDRPATTAAQAVDPAWRSAAQRRRPAIDAALDRVADRSDPSYRAALDLLDDHLLACWQARLAGTSTGAETYRPIDGAHRWNDISWDFAAWLERVRSIDDEIIVDPGGAEAEARAEDRVAAGMLSFGYQTLLQHEMRFDRHLARTVETLAKLRRIRERMAPEDYPGPDGNGHPGERPDSSKMMKDARSARVPDQAERAADVEKWFSVPTTDPNPSGRADRIAPPNRKERRRLQTLERRRRAA
jgi:hypothetical protein